MVEVDDFRTVCLVGPYGSSRRKLAESLVDVWEGSVGYFREDLTDCQMKHFFDDKVLRHLFKLQARQIREFENVCLHESRVVSDIHPFGVYSLFSALYSGNERRYEGIRRKFLNSVKGGFVFGFMNISDSSLEKELVLRDMDVGFRDKVLSYNYRFLEMYDDLKEGGGNVFRVDVDELDVSCREDVRLLLEKSIYQKTL